MSKVSRHGEQRVRKRLGLPKKTVQKMADQALLEGRKHNEFSGSFKRYLDSVYFQHEKATNMRVYRQYLFIFRGETLITAWQVPNKYRKTADVRNSRSRPSRNSPGNGGDGKEPIPVIRLEQESRKPSGENSPVQDQ